VTIAFCIPGKAQSMEFTESWTNLVVYMVKRNIDFYLHQYYSADIYDCRNNLVTEEAHIPWEMMPVFLGKPYDYMMWIDSDIGFKPEDVMKLVNTGQDVISGVCPMGPTMRCPAGRFGYDEYGQPSLDYISIAELDNVDQDTLIPVEFAGYGFIAVKQGVFEAMEYPWFRTTIRKHAGREVNPSEDLGWCIRAREKGFKVWLYPGVRLTHNKELCLRAE